MLSFYQGTFTQANGGYLLPNSPQCFALTSNNSSMPPLSPRHPGLSMQDSSGISLLPCRRTHYEPSMKFSRPRHRTAHHVPASGSQRTLTPTSAQCLETNTNGPQLILTSPAPPPPRSNLPTFPLKPHGTKSCAKPQSPLTQPAAFADASYPSQQWIHPRPRLPLSPAQLIARHQPPTNRRSNSPALSPPATPSM